MTLLASISNNHLSLKCQLCVHQSMIAVQHLIAKLGREIGVHHVVPKLRCAECGTKSKATFVITYVGASGTATLGARLMASMLIMGVDRAKTHRLREQGLRTYKIAANMGISRMTVHMILSG